MDTAEDIVQDVYQQHFSDHFSLCIAPTFDVRVSQLQNAENTAIGSEVAPWTVYHKTFDVHTSGMMWPAFQLGLRLILMII